MTEAKKEYKRRKAKEHYWNNREKHLAYHNARWHSKKSDPEFREKRRQYSKQYYATNKDQLKIKSKAWRLKNQEARSLAGKVQHYRKKYGITLAERDTLFAANNGLCYICSKRPSEVVDHDHDTGRVRGALCHPCNRMLGAVRDDPEVLLSGADYLRRETCVIS